MSRIFSLVSREKEIVARQGYQTLKILPYLGLILVEEAGLHNLMTIIIVSPI
jgi:hypothetical protein